MHKFQILSFIQLPASHRPYKTHSFYLYLWIRGRLNNWPDFLINVIAVKVIWQRVISCTTKNVQLRIITNHCVPVSPGRWRWGTAKNMLCWYSCPAKTDKISFEFHLSQGLKFNCLDFIPMSYNFSWKWNWNKVLVIFAPLWPLKRNMESAATAKGKLQQVGGQSPVWAISSQLRDSPLTIKFVLIICS